MIDEVAFFKLKFRVLPLLEQGAFKLLVGVLLLFGPDICLVEYKRVIFDVLLLLEDR